MSQLAAMHPMGRYGSVDDVTGAAVFLASDEASFVTGVILHGVCRFCVAGRNVLCEAAARAAALGTMFDGTTRFFDDGKPVYHLALTSSFCEYTVAPHNGAITIPMAEQACLLGCGAMTGLGAVLNTARVRPGESVAVFGCGGVGLSVIQASRLCNALPIVAVDAQASKEAVAHQFGATHFVHAEGSDPVPAVREFTDGGADYAFESVGRVDTAEGLSSDASRWHDGADRPASRNRQGRLFALRIPGRTENHRVKLRLGSALGGLPEDTSASPSTVCSTLTIWCLTSGRWLGSMKRSLPSKPEPSTEWCCRLRSVTAGWKPRAAPRLAQFRCYLQCSVS